MMEHKLRLATASDSNSCAEIVNNWIDRTTWMPRRHSHEAIKRMIKDGMPHREFWVIGEPVKGYLSFDIKAKQIMGLYVASPGQGLGKLLLDRVKLGKQYIKLWSHSKNISAHDFYLREGFKLTGDKKIGYDEIEEKCFEWRK